jgi:hypothetical protein
LTELGLFLARNFYTKRALRRAEKELANHPFGVDHTEAKTRLAARFAKE